MTTAKTKLLSFLGNKDNLIHLFLASAFVALGVRSSKQQGEIEALEAEKTSLKTENKAMASAMWEWRQNLFGLAEADPSAAPIALARLRAIYGEEEPPAAGGSDRGFVEREEDSVSIA